MLPFPGDGCVGGVGGESVAVFLREAGDDVIVGVSDFHFDVAAVLAGGIDLESMGGGA